VRISRAALSSLARVVPGMPSREKEVSYEKLAVWPDSFLKSVTPSHAK